MREEVREREGGKEGGREIGGREGGREREGEGRRGHLGILCHLVVFTKQLFHCLFGGANVAMTTSQLVTHITQPCSHLRSCDSHVTTTFT